MRLGYVILYVPDVRVAVAFYERAFGLAARMVTECGNFAEMETGGTSLAFTAESFLKDENLGFRPLRPDDSPPGAELALVTDDVAATLDRAVAAGAVLVKALESKPWGQTVAYVRDPHGFLVEFCTPVG